MNNSLLLAKDQGSIVKLNKNQQAHFIPKSVRDNPNYPLKFKEKNIVEMYDGYIIIRPKKTQEEEEK